MYSTREASSRVIRRGARPAPQVEPSGAQSPAGRLDSWLAGWLAGWVVGWLAGWLDGWLAGWVAEWVAGWPSGRQLAD